MGNPNCGKTALFNKLTGLHHKVGNYPGITVEKKSGRMKDRKIELRDFPGTYSLKAGSIDEKIVADTVQSWRKKKNRPLALIVVLDATNLHKNMYLALQLLDWNLPTILVLNMIDEVRKKNIKIEPQQLLNRLKARAIIPASAKSGEGIDKIFGAVDEIIKNPKITIEKPRLLEIERILNPISPLLDTLRPLAEKLQHHPLIEALRLLGEPKYIDNLAEILPVKTLEQIQDKTLAVKETLEQLEIATGSLEQTSRFAYIDLYLNEFIHEHPLHKPSVSEKIDSILTHHIWGPVSLFLMLAFIFNSIFSWAQYPMQLIDASISMFSNYLSTFLEAGILKSLILDGIVAGVGSILVFFPQIILLVLFITLLEDSGYMARMAFMMDRFMAKIGLSGRSVLPLLSGFACAIPGIMAARTIDNWRERIITIMLTPMMSCSARLPIYSILIAAFIPQYDIFGFISLQAATLMAVYFLGTFTAILVAIIFKIFYPSESTSTAVMELPPYRIPLIRSVLWRLYERGKSFLTTAGSIILTVSIVLWFLASFPKQKANAHLSKSQEIELSYAGQIGKTIEPIIEPLGFDWKIGVGLISSFAAREVIISVLSTLYNIENDGEHKSLITALKAAKKADGKPVFTALSALSLIVFFVYAAQCMATFAIIRKETNSWVWPFLKVVYMTVFAYGASLLVYQGGLLLGYQ
jgi:ferrous iron transport protein B